MPGRYDNFAKCLTEEGFVMAGADWCSFCKQQKASFGKSFEYIDYKNCYIEKEGCNSNPINSYPTWLLPDGNRITGKQELATLSRFSSKCKLE